MSPETQDVKFGTVYIVAALSTENTHVALKPQAASRPLHFVPVLVIDKVSFEQPLIARKMAAPGANETVHGVPPSLSAKVVGYVDNFVTMFNNVANYTAVSKGLHKVRTVVFKLAVALACC